jgi:RNA polymerase sigma-70 factor (ECF subfamily)
MVGTKEEAEDAMQDMFLKLYRNIGQFRFKSKISSYMISILINSCYDILKKRSLKAESLENNDFGFEKENDWQLTLESAIADLPLKMKECFILFAIEGFKQREIAQMLNIQEGTVKAHISQAKVKLRKLIEV